MAQDCGCRQRASGWVPVEAIVATRTIGPGGAPVVAVEAAVPWWEAALGVALVAVITAVGVELIR
jgi:hypothetical protein